MPLIKKKSQKSFDHNLKAEMEEGKPQKQALAIAYNTQKHARKKMAEGGLVKPLEQEKKIELDPDKQKKVADSMKKAFGFAEGGEVHELQKPTSIVEGVMRIRDRKKEVEQEPPTDPDEQYAEGGEVESEDLDQGASMPEDEDMEDAKSMIDKIRTRIRSRI